MIKTLWECDGCGKREELSEDMFLPNGWTYILVDHKDSNGECSTERLCACCRRCAVKAALIWSKK